MVQTANAIGQDDRLTFVGGIAEQISYPDETFDLIVSSTSFDHWSDQQAGLRECVRVLRPGGRLVLVDQFSWMLLPTMLTSRRGKARTRRRASRLLLRAGFASPLAPAACGDHQRGDGNQAGLGAECAEAAVEHLQVTDRPAGYDRRIHQRQLQRGPGELLWGSTSSNSRA